MIPRRRRGLVAERKATTALEFALVCPAFVVFIFGMISIYSLLAARRAMDYGLDKALRTAAVNSAGGTSAVQTAYFAGAATFSGDVGTSSAHSTVTVSPSAFTVGKTVTITATYNWTAIANYVPVSTALFSGLTLTTSVSVLCIN